MLYALSITPSTAQGVGSRLEWGRDSISQVRQLVANVGPIRDSLTALYFSRIRERGLRKQLADLQLDRDTTAASLASAIEEKSNLTTQLLDCREQKRSEKKKSTGATVDLWMTRAALAVSLYLQIRR